MFPLKTCFADCYDNVEPQKFPSKALILTPLELYSQNIKCIP